MCLSFDTSPFHKLLRPLFPGQKTHHRGALPENSPLPPNPEWKTSNMNFP